MVFLEVLLALTIERLWLSVAKWRRFTWFMRFAAWSETRGSHASVSITHPTSDDAPVIPSTSTAGDTGGRARVLLLTLVPAAAVGLIHYLLSESLLILAFIFDVAVLLYCLGPKDLDTQVRAFIHAYTHTGKEAACHHLADIINNEGADIESKTPLTTTQMLHAVIEAILIEANERWFAVIFWFVVLGPLGAVFYRLSSLLQNNADELRPDNFAVAASGTPDNFAAAAQHLHAILGWLPARITALSYAIMGSFVDAIDGWSQGIPNQLVGQLVTRSSGNADVVRNSGLGALRMNDVVQGTAKKTMSISHVRNALALVWRTLIFCLGVLLVVSLMSWLV